jgi:hypothetical protein
MHCGRSLPKQGLRQDSTFHRRSSEQRKMSRCECESVIHYRARRLTPAFISIACLLHQPGSALAKPPNFKQEKKRREDAQKKKNEAKQRDNVARKESTVRAPPKP